MKFLLSFIVAAATVIVSALAAPPAEAGDVKPRPGTPSAIGVEGGYYYWWTTDNKATAYYTNQKNGSYSVQWFGRGHLVGGKGWNPGSVDRVVNYNGTYRPRGNSYLAVYGWTRNVLSEYYIVESYGTRDPSRGAQIKGNVTCNGARYEIFSILREEQPSIEGTQTFEQLWSVRNPKKRTGRAIRGTVDLACHFEAWKSAGMKLGSEHSLQIMATEGNSGSGSASITVS